MFCSNCGAEVKGKFCVKCGTKVAEEIVTPVVAEPTPVAPVLESVSQGPGTKEKGKKKIWIPILAAIILIAVAIVVIINVNKVKTPEKAFNIMKNALQTGNTSKIKKITKPIMSGINSDGESVKHVFSSLYEEILEACGSGFTVKLDTGSSTSYDNMLDRLSANTGYKVDQAIGYFVYITASGPNGTYQTGVSLTLLKIKGSMVVVDIYQQGS